MKAFLKSKVGIITSAVVSITVITVVILIIVLQPDTYRTIVAVQKEGIVTVTNTKSTDIEVYDNMNLYSGDRISVADDSWVMLELDGDKHVLAEENTKLRLEASGTVGTDKTIIHLEEGSALIRIENKLNENQIYEVHTPNSVISVRGTVFRVTVPEIVDKKSFVSVEAFDGEVTVTPINDEYVETDGTEAFTVGESGMVEGDGSLSMFIRTSEGDVHNEVDYDALSKEAVEKLIEFIDDGEKLSVDKEYLTNLIAQPQAREEIVQPSIAPNVSAASEPSATPEVSAMPKSSVEPEMSAMPESSIEPEMSAMPESSIEPKVSEAPKATATPTATPTAMLKPTTAPTATPKPTATSTATLKPTTALTSTPTPTVAPTATPTPTAAPTATPTPTAAPTATPTPTAALTATPTPTAAPTATPTPTAVPTATPTPTTAPTATPAPTVAPTATPTPSVHQHMGGIASCTGQAVCESCGEKYGELLEHSYGEGWLTDEKYHWHECAYCGIVSEKTLHTGTEATCSSPSVCTVCGESLGESLEHVANENYTYDDNKHYINCVTCSKIITEEKHLMYKVGTEGEADIYRCSTCGYVKEQLPTLSY